MQLLLGPEGNFLRFKSVVIDTVGGGLKDSPRHVNIRVSTVVEFGESAWPGICRIEVDSRTCPSEDEGAPVIYHVRAKESEIRGMLGLKVHGQGDRLKGLVT